MMGGFNSTLMLAAYVLTYHTNKKEKKVHSCVLEDTTFLNPEQTKKCFY